MLRDKQLRPRKYKELVQGHRAKRWKSTYQNLGRLAQALNQCIVFQKTNLTMTCKAKCRRKKDKRQEMQLAGSAVNNQR